MNTAPRRARLSWNGLLTVGVILAAPFVTTSGCGEDRTLVQDPDATGALTGTVQIYVADYDNGTTERIHFLEVTTPQERAVRLRFATDPTLTSGDRLRAWGTAQKTQDGDELVVSRFEVLPPPESDLTTLRSALTTVTPKSNKNAFVLVDVGGNVNITADAAAMTVFSPGNNFANVYNILSYGSMNYSGDVLGPFQYPMTTCDYNGLQKAVKAMITTGTYDHYMWYIGSQFSACQWSGLGAEGSAARPASDSWFNASTGCTVLVQEVGHNNGWMHSSTLTCSGASFVDDPTGSGCTTSEYGNRYTPMGSGCGHFDAMDKWYGQYFGGCNGVKVTSSGTFNLLPIETPCNGIQGLQLPMPKTTRTFKSMQGNTADPIKNYYLELRVNGTPAESTSVKAPAVFVNVGNDIQPATKTSFHSFLLDMNPSTTNAFDGMTAAGQSFSDPAGGLTFTVMSIDATHASIQVTYDNGTGAPTCMDGSTLTAPGPTDCSTATTSTPGTGGTSGGVGGTTGTTGTAGRSGAGGRGGTTGTAGTTGTTTGTAGRGGTTGTTTGTGGTTVVTTGTAGTTGTTTGTAGTTGTATGTAGTIGTTTGTAGTIGTTTGSAGTIGTTSGAAGTTSVTGAAGTSPTGPGQAPSPVVGGCACSTAPDGGAFARGSWLGLGLLGAVVIRRRRRSRSGP
jgi:MYXO-CTERM domain-containing protein